MSEELEAKIEKLFANIYLSTDLKFMRPFKRQMYRCGIDCLDDKNELKDIDSCIQTCGKTIHEAMGILTKEGGAFQQQLDRCLTDCQVEVRNEKDDMKAKSRFDVCADKCLAKFTPLSLDVIRTIDEKLDKLERNTRLV